MALVSDIEKPFRWMDRQLARPDDVFSSSFPLVPSDFWKPWDNVFRPWEKVMRPAMNQLASAMNELAMTGSENVTSDGEKFQVSVDVQHFAPEEITVKVVDRAVQIEGRHEEKRDPHGYVSRQFVRRYALPQGCLPDTVRSSLSSDGVLTVTAPKVLPLPSTGERIVPVSVQRRWY